MNKSQSQFKIESFNQHWPIHWQWACSQPDNWNTVHLQRVCLFMMGLNQKGINHFANITLLWWAPDELWLGTAIILQTWIISVAICFYCSPVYKAVEFYLVNSSWQTVSKSNSCQTFMYICGSVKRYKSLQVKIAVFSLFHIHEYIVG